MLFSSNKQKTASTSSVLTDVYILRKVLQDLTVCWESTESAFEDEQQIIKHTHSLSASGLFDGSNFIALPPKALKNLPK